MRVLFIAYCMGTDRGPAQIGVYKRGLRIGLELADRGNEVVLYCTGRHNFRDSLPAAAEERVRFVEFPFVDPPAAADAGDAVRRNRSAFLAELAALRPDAVVIGEAPLAGTLLETTLSAVESRIPTVLLDNTYHSRLVDGFWRRHGPMFDAVVLSGPSALQGPCDSPYLTQVPPYVEASLPQARAVLAAAGLAGRRLVVVLGYDENVVRLGLSLLRRLDEPGLGALLLTPDVAGIRARIAGLPPAVAAHVRALAPPPDPVLFGLLALADLAVVKGGFMQLTETLSLGTPVIAFWYELDYASAQLPDVLRSATHVTVQAEADGATLAAATAFLRLPKDGIAVHDGTSGAAAKAADVIEALPRTPRRDTSADAARLGFTERRMRRALRRLGGGRAVPVVHQTRAGHLRTMPDHELYSVLCDCTVDGSRRVERLWGRVYGIPVAPAAGGQAPPPRRVLYARGTVLVEVDLGEGALPTVKDVQVGETDGHRPAGRRRRGFLSSLGGTR
jgi:hypothetical protein